MANVADIKRKEIKLTLMDGVERTLKFDLNALAELEDRYGTVDAAFESLDAGSIKAIRTVLWAGFLHEQPDITEQQVGSLIDIQYMQELMETLGKAFEQDLPKQSTEGEESPN